MMNAVTLITRLKHTFKKNSGLTGEIYPVRKKVFPSVDEEKVIPVDRTYKANLVLLMGSGFT